MRSNLISAFAAAAVLGTAGRVTAAPQYTTLPIAPDVPEQKTYSNNTDASVVDVLLSPPSIAEVLNIPPKPEPGIITVPSPFIPSNETDMPLVFMSEGDGSGDISPYHNGTDGSQRVDYTNSCLESDRWLYKRWYVSSQHPHLKASWVPRLCGDLWDWLEDVQKCPVLAYAHCGPYDDVAGTGLHWTFNTWSECTREHVEHVFHGATARDFGAIHCSQW